MVYAHGLEPCAERLRGSNPLLGIYSLFKILIIMSLHWRILILIVIVVCGLLINYRQTDEDVLIFPVMESPGLAFLSLTKEVVNNDNHQSLFGADKFWGWPFTYWHQGQFELKFLIFNFIFYIILWLLILSIIWFFIGIKKIRERKLKPPKFDF